jgi:hypothetical protein
VTSIYNRVRFGRQHLSKAESRDLNALLEGLEQVEK